MNPEVIQELRNAAKIQPGSRESIPSNLSGSIVPILDVTPKNVKTARVMWGQAINATGGTVLSASAFADFDVYIIGAQLAVIKDVTSTSTSSKLNVTINGLVTTLISLPGISLTPQTLSESISFNHPIKIDRNTAVSLANTTAVGNVTLMGSVYFYLDEVTNG